MLFSVFSCKNEAKTENTNASEATSDSSGYRQDKVRPLLKMMAQRLMYLQIAIGSPDHTTLVAAVQAASLENALVNAGPLMVFAPTNEAFAALPEGTVEDLLKPENKETLANILKHHVTAGNYSKEFLKKFKKLGQANDQSVIVEVKGDDVYVGGAKIIGKYSSR